MSTPKKSTGNKVEWQKEMMESFKQMGEGAKILAKCIDNFIEITKLTSSVPTIKYERNIEEILEKTEKVIKLISESKMSDDLKEGLMAKLINEVWDGKI